MNHQYLKYLILIAGLGFLALMSAPRATATTTIANCAAASTLPCPSDGASPRAARSPQARQESSTGTVARDRGRKTGLGMGEHNLARPSAIDLGLTWNTFLGDDAGGEDHGFGIAVDASGNVYVAGWSEYAWGSPVRAFSVSIDAFAAKLDRNGNLIWNTFLGGSGLDSARGIAVDGSGNVFVAGSSTAAWGSPMRNYTARRDAFVAKLSSSGNLLWNTFLGGTQNENIDEDPGIAVDGSGIVYVVGYSQAAWGSPIRAYTMGRDPFVAKLDSSGNLMWNTFLGGTSYDEGLGIAVDESGNAYVAGYSGDTWGSPIRGYAGGWFDAFIAKLDSNGNLLWNTFLGGSSDDRGYTIALDGSRNAYVAGYSGATWGSPVSTFTDRDALAAKVDSSGNLIWNTFLGGSGLDDGWGIAVDVIGNVLVAGQSDAGWGAPVRPFALQTDAFAAKLDNNGNLTRNTFLGANQRDEGNAIAIDADGNAYVAGTSELTWGSPVRKHLGWWHDAFAAKLATDLELQRLSLPLIIR